MNIDRRLATVRRIAELNPIEGADNIELAVVDGWQVVVKKGEFHVGQLAIYFEIDSWIPIALAPFLRKPGHPDREFEGVNGERLRTIRLRGQISQGLLLPATIENPIEGEDVTEVMMVKKWERPVPTQLAGTVKGNFPWFIVKTDQPRVQNVWAQYRENTDLFEITEKLDGSSMTVYHFRDPNTWEVTNGVCSRNLDLKPDANNAFWMVAMRDHLVEKLATYGRNIALQGELIGPGIQGNSYKLDRLEFYCFDIFDIHNQRYLECNERRRLCLDMDIQHVPQYGLASINKVSSFEGQPLVHQSIYDMLRNAEGKSQLNRQTEREGIVYKSATDPAKSFKVISNKWLLKEKE